MSKQKTIAAIGDSITRGFPYSRSWTHKLSECLGTDVINAGINGDLLANMPQRLATDILSHSPDYVILMGGANDAYQGGSVLEMQMATRKIIENVLKVPAHIVVCLPPPIAIEEIEAPLSQYRAWLREKHKELGAHLMNFEELFYKDGKINRGYLPDDVHPSEVAYEKMGEQACTFFASLFNSE